MLPKEIDGVRIIGIDVPGFGVPTHAEAKDVLAGAMLNYALKEISAGPVKPLAAKTDKDRPKITLYGRDVPGGPISIGQMLEPMGLQVGTVVPTREWRELYAALDCSAVAAIHPFYTASVREFQSAGRPIIGSAPVGVAETDRWLDAIGGACNVPTAVIDQTKAPLLASIKQVLDATPIKGRITLSGY